MPGTVQLDYIHTLTHKIRRQAAESLRRPRQLDDARSITATAAAAAAAANCGRGHGSLIDG